MTDIWSFVPLPYPAGLAFAVLRGLLWLALLGSGWWRGGAAWVGLVAGCALFPPAIGWVQVPLQQLTGTALQAFVGQQTLAANLLVFGFPQIFETGLVQEAAKLLPVLIYVTVFRPRGPSAPLRMGAAVGAGFGAFEAAWAIGLVFANGWSLDTFQLAGWAAALPFAERFVTVGFHTASGIILAYGLVRGMAPWTYLLAALLHTAVNYGAILRPAGLVTTTLAAELYVTFWCIVTVAIALWLRSRATDRRTVGVR
ncbi:MAG: hypothetical protein ACYC7H_03105 [Chloroflexota bacterium]